MPSSNRNGLILRGSITFTLTLPIPIHIPKRLLRIKLCIKMAGFALLLSDFLVSFMWVWSGVLIKIFVYNILGLGHEPIGEVIKCSLSIIIMFFFAFLAKVTNGGAYNPLTVLSSAISGDFSHFLFTVGARIPAQVVFNMGFISLTF